MAIIAILIVLLAGTILITSDTNNAAEYESQASNYTGGYVYLYDKDDPDVQLPSDAVTSDMELNFPK